MSTEARVRASRENGRKSKGPKTPEGKARSSKNALKHGLLASSIVLDDESQERFDALVEDFHHQFKPRTAVERSLVENLACVRWRQMRLWCFEKSTLQREIKKHPEIADPGDRAGFSFDELANKSRTLDLLGRYESRYDRLYQRSLAQLRKKHDKKIPKRT